MAKSRLHKLSKQGVSVWIDSLSREMLETGELARLMKEDAVVGVTSNPTIFQKALAGGSWYDEQLRQVLAEEEDTKEILSATGLVKALTAVLAVLLVFASIALIANTIRLSVFARRREVEVMKLVGATNWFIRWPFVIEGVIVGFFGGVLAVLLLTIAKETFIDPLSERFALLAAPETIDFPLLIVVLMLACIAVSALGSGITLRRFLKV